MTAAVDMSTASSVLTLRSSDFSYGDYVLQLRSWNNRLAFNDITPEWQCMAQSLKELLKTQALNKSFWAWKMMVKINCWKLIVFIF